MMSIAIVWGHPQCPRITFSAFRKPVQLNRKYACDWGAALIETGTPLPNVVPHIAIVCGEEMSAWDQRFSFLSTDFSTECEVRIISLGRTMTDGNCSPSTS
jgi:hypothetical protein